MQARHLAEMGILHYKAEIERALAEYHKIPFEYEYVIVNKNKEINQASSQKKYYKELCEAVKKVELRRGPNNVIGSYVLIYNNNFNCSVAVNPPKELKLSVRSTGDIRGESKVINATVTLSPESTLNNPEVPGNIPQKPAYPENNWTSKVSIPNFDYINNSRAVKADDSTKKTTFETTAFVELNTNLNMPKKSIWKFNDHLIVIKNVTTETGGKDGSTLTVNKDFYIGGALDALSNHTIINAVNDFVVMGTAKFGTKSRLTIGGNALFNSGISELAPSATIIIEGNAYFKQSLGTVKSGASVCVRKDIFLWKQNKWEPYLATDVGYGGFKNNCGNTPKDPNQKQPGPYNWIILPEVNAKYM